MISGITLEEVKIAINSLKNWKAQGSNDIPAELIKYSGEEMHKVIFKICQRTWEEEQMPEDWKKALIIPIHKKGDKTECGNYRGISLLNSAYKVFSKVLLNHISAYIEENLDEYKCGFRKGRIDQTISETLAVETGLKQLDALSPLLFNLALEKEVREMQKETTGIEINQHKLQILGFADDLNIIGNTRDDTEKAAKVLEKSADKIGLKINNEKTKIMELLDADVELTDHDSDDWIYEKRHLHYPNFSKLKCCQRKLKLNFSVIVRAILTYGYEAWTTTSVTEQRLTTFENKIWRVICGSKLDANTSVWRRKFNKELIEEAEMTPIKYYIRGQRMQLFGHIMLGSDDKIIKTVMSWKPTGKRPRGCLRKRYVDVVEEDKKNRNR
ncbi:hypothetical protein QTP88_016423 [Uroleucon formosanum]